MKIPRTVHRRGTRLLFSRARQTPLAGQAKREDACRRKHTFLEVAIVTGLAGGVAGLCYLLRFFVASYEEMCDITL